ncbi:hypothetical protein D3C81_1254610 [compost metagenome]
MVLAALDRLHGAAHGADRLGQAACQAIGHQQGQGQGQHGQAAGTQQDLLLALAEGLVGHADQHQAKDVLAGIGLRLGGREQEGVVERDRLAQDRRLEHFDPRLAHLVSLFDIGEHLAFEIAYLDEAHVRGVQAGTQQAVEDRQVAGDHAVFGGRRQLVGDLLAGLGQLLSQVLQAGVGEVAGQQQGQQQRRAKADGQGAGADIALSPAHHHLLLSQCCRRPAWSTSSLSSMPSERATCGLLRTLK